MGINHQNLDYLPGPTWPTAVGDRYYAQDIFRDFHYNNDDSGRKVAYGFTGFPILLKDSNMTKGTNWDDLDIPIAKGIVEYEIDVPNSYAALPPTVTQEDIYVRIETSVETDFDISGATLDGVTTNYVKVTYNETDGSTRTRAKKAGTYVYEKAISYTITVTPAAPTSKDLVLGTVVGDGATFLTVVSYPRTRRYGDEYDYVVGSQEEFNIIIDRTAANQYRIKDNIKSVYVKYLAGGYQMTGATSPLQGGDAYGYIETNDCTRLIFTQGAYIDMHQNKGYLEVDTDYCYLENVSIQGDTGASSAIIQSYLLNANYVTYMNCNCINRSSSTNMRGFYGSGTTLHNQTSKYIGCIVKDLIAISAIYGFSRTENMDGCRIEDLQSGTLSSCFGIFEGKNISNCRIRELDGQSIGIADSENISNCEIIDLDGGVVYGIFNCNNITNTTITDLDAATTTCYGIHLSNNISNCRITQLDAVGNCYGIHQSNYISACQVEDVDSSGGNAAGCYDCDQITASRIVDIDTVAGTAYGFFQCTSVSSAYTQAADYGFYNCDRISAVFSGVHTIDGFYNCDRINAATSFNNANNGYTDCDYIAMCYATTNGVDGFNNCDTVIGSNSISNTGDGFQDCNHIEHNRSVGNGGAAYNNCFADLAATRAAAATDAGGENA